MKKLLLVIAVVSAFVSASAQSFKSLESVNTPFAKAIVPMRQGNFVAPNPSVLDLLNNRKSLRKVAKRRSSLSLDQVTGNYIISCYSAVNGQCPSSAEVSVTSLGSDSVSITGIPYTDEVHAKIDLETDSIKIPSQVVNSYTNIGNVSIAVSDNYGIPVRTEEITGIVDPETGLITFDADKLFGVFIDSGTYKDYFLAIWEAVFTSPINGTFTANNASSEIGDVSNNINIAQLNDSTLVISNFYGGTMLSIKLDSDSVAIPKQYILDGGSSTGDFYFTGLVYIDDTPYLYSPVPGKVEENTISIAPFTLYSDSGFWYNLFSNGLITYTSDSTTTGITTVSRAGNAGTTVYYNLAGNRSEFPFRGINIAVITDENGKATVRKFIHK